MTSTSRSGTASLPQKRSMFTSSQATTLALWVGASRGRRLSDSDDSSSAAPAAILSYRAWKDEYDGDPSIVGSTIFIQAFPVVIEALRSAAFSAIQSRTRLPAYGFHCHWRHTSIWEMTTFCRLKAIGFGSSDECGPASTSPCSKTIFPRLYASGCCRFPFISAQAEALCF